MTAGSDVLAYILSAGGAIAAFALLTLWIVLAPGSLRARRCLVAITVVFAFLSIYGFQSLVARALIRSFRPFEASHADRGQPTAIVVLGSGSVTAEDWDGGILSFVDRTAAIRVTEAVRVFRLVEPAVIVSSGGEPHARKRGAPTGETMRDALVAAGVPRERIVVETESKTTRGEALVVARLLAERRIAQVILVTSGSHMVRALGAFRAAGINAIPALAQEFDPDPSAAVFLLPSKQGLGVASATAHEVVGLAYYWARGWWRR